MKKIYFKGKKVFLLFIFLSSVNLILSNCYAASGLFDAFAIVNRNGGGNELIGVSVFDGFNLGSYNNTQSIILNGGQNKTFKNGALMLQVAR